MCLQTAGSWRQRYHYSTYLSCKSTSRASDDDSRTSFSSFLRRGICCLKLLGLGSVGSVCRLSRNYAHEDVHEGQDEMIKLTSLAHSSHDKSVANSDNKCDEEDLDSGLQVSQESTLDSGSGIMVANPLRALSVRPDRVAVKTGSPLVVRETLSSTHGETGNFVEAKDSETYKKNPAFVTKADVLWENEKQLKCPEHEYRGQKPNTKDPQYDRAVDCNETKIPADKRKDYASSDFERNSISGYNDEEATKSSFCKDSKESFQTDCSDRQCVSVEDLFTKRKLSTEDDELLTSRQIDDVIQVRRHAPATPDIDDDEATVAKQPVATVATVTNRSVLLDNFISKGHDD